MINLALARQLELLANQLETSERPAVEIDSRNSLRELAGCDQWGETQFKLLDFLSKRLDINGKLFEGYDSNGRKLSEAIVDEPVWLELLVGVLLKGLVLSQLSNSKELTLKRFNVLFKSLDLVQPHWLSKGTELEAMLNNMWIACCRAAERSADLPISSIPKGGKQTGLRHIPLTVLFYEGPIARAYLATLRHLGLRPEKIIELVSSKDLVTGRPVGRWLPNGIRLSYAATVQHNKIHYWSKKLSKSHPELIAAIGSAVDEKFGFAREVVAGANSFLPLSSYSDRIDSLMVNGLDDPKLFSYLTTEPAAAVLYTGGGIVPAALLQLSHTRLLHIHPGFLPAIRGADCALWSSLLQRRMSASCFYMAPGIDSGDIILSSWLPELSVRGAFSGIDSLSLYRATYAFIDPWVRAFLLRELVLCNDSFEFIPATSQAEYSGNTYHFMHNKLKNLAFQKIYKIRRDSGPA